MTKALLPVLALLFAAGATKIPMETLRVDAAPAGAGQRVVVKNVLKGEIPGVVTDQVSITGPASHHESAGQGTEVVWLFLGGKGSLKTGSKTYQIDGETVARAPLGWTWDVEAPAGSVLHALRIRKTLSEADRAEYRKFPQNNAAPHVMKFSECPTYGEAIKSKKTTSRTLLPENFVPRMAVGTVETTGPDVVGAHKHPMLEQLFLGLKDNDITVVADDARANLKQFTLLHIPLGSNHGAEVAAGKKLHYVWMDFFTTKEGQEWLKMHKPEPQKKK
jgi:hypothetical protein